MMDDESETSFRYISSSQISNNTGGSVETAGGNSIEDNDSDLSEDDFIIRSRYPFKNIRGLSAVSPPQRLTQYGGHSAKEAEADFTRTLSQLEPFEEIERSYPPRFSSSTNGASYLQESQVLEEFALLDDQHVENEHSDTGATFLEIEIEQFCVYQSTEKNSNLKTHRGLEGRYSHLHIVSSDIGYTDWLIDGTLQNNGDRKSFLRGRILDVNIGGLEDTTQSSAAESIWIQTAEGEKKDYWYRLISPSTAYNPFWLDFLWLADFVKFFIDFLYVNSNHGKLVCLADFKSDFWNWLWDLHGAEIRKWHSQCGARTDFRQDVLSYALFLRAQTYSLQKDSNNLRLDHPVWNEVAAGRFSQDRQASSKDEKTVVTANVASLFSTVFPHWQKVHRILETVEPCSEIELYTERRRRKWSFPDKFKYSQKDHFRGKGANKISKAIWLLEDAAVKDRPARIYNAKKLLHKVVIVRKTFGKPDFRYAWVRAASSPSMLTVVWLLLPSDTICGTREESACYPIGNELFFSDECSCMSVSIYKVIEAIEVSVFTDHTEDGADLFIHGLYRIEEQTHISVTSEQDLVCPCKLNDKSAKRAAHQSSVFIPKMKICALCSGAGLLDLAFHEFCGGETVLAVEHNEIAARSHKANNPYSQCDYHIDSVNSILKSYMTGEKPLSHLIDCIIAGCPCQGWSKLNPTKGSDSIRNVRNRTILANMLSWIEVLSPAFVLIENVVQMASSAKGPSACVTAVCYLVALGYSAKVCIKKDCSVGGASIRERLFIIAGAPGMDLPNDIPDTHGEGLRVPMTAGKAIQDLAPIENDTMVNLTDPNHIPIQQMKIKWDIKLGKEISIRSLLPKISTSLSDAYYAGRLSPLECEFFKKRTEPQRARKSKSLMRINPTQPFQTIATIISAFDAWFGGRCLHPTQNRLLSLREICRAMGMPDSFLLAGPITKKYAQAGNGVPWALGGGWGKSFGQAWAESLKRRGGIPLRAEESFQLAQNDTISVQVRVSTKKNDVPLVMERLSTMATIRTRPRKYLRVIPDDSDSDSDSAMLLESSQDTIVISSRSPHVLIKQEYLSSTEKDVTKKSTTRTDLSEIEVIDLTGDSEEHKSNTTGITTLNLPTRRTATQSVIKKETPTSVRGWQHPMAIKRVVSTPLKRKAPEGATGVSGDNELFDMEEKTAGKTNKRTKRW